MSDLIKLAQLVSLSEAQYRRQQQSIQRVLAEEARLREGLHKLDRQLEDSRDNGDQAQQALGADLLWQGWVGRQKAQLNQQLARLMVIKEQHLVQVRRAYGKYLVSKKLHADAELVKKQKNDKMALDRAIGMSVFR